MAIAARAEARDAQQRRAPVGDGAEIVDEPAQRGLHLHEGAGRHHQAAEGQVAREIERRRREDRRHQREPAVAGGDPGEIGESGDQAAHGLENGGEIDLDAARLVRLARGERDRIDVLVHPHQRKAQVRLARVALRIAIDQVASHPIAQQRSGARRR